MAHPLASELVKDLGIDLNDIAVVANPPKDPYVKGGEKYEEFLQAHEDLRPEQLAPRLHGQTNPPTAIEKEKPVHRMMAYMVASGRSVKEIAQQTGYSEVQIRHVIRQPWCQQLITAIIKENGEDEVQARLRGAAVDTVITLIELRDTADTASVRLGASKEILDRVLGKAPQTINHHEKKDPKDELQEIERELQSVRGQEKKMLE